ncbi:MAG TPA: HAD family phosphatase [Thermoleophilaceae bacterium]|jgi:HAD superfamily hydrolase (TIGR01509 family)
MGNLPLEPAAVQVLLCDADGNLFPSEEPAFEASAVVTNRMMEAIGSTVRFDPVDLRLRTTGLNFRSTAGDLAVAAGRPLPSHELEHWVEEEARAVTAHLARVLKPNRSVTRPLERLARDLELAAVSSSALARLAACFEATGLAELLPPGRRFSAEDSLPVPRSKPDPAIYAHALAELGVPARRALAVEDSVPGARSALAAGIPTVGNVMFVPGDERAARRAALAEAGAAAVVSSWVELERLLMPRPRLSERRDAAGASA